MKRFLSFAFLAILTVAVVIFVVTCGQAGQRAVNDSNLAGGTAGGGGTTDDDNDDNDDNDTTPDDDDDTTPFTAAGLTANEGGRLMAPAAIVALADAAPALDELA
jgi:hypothetical protein